MTTFLKDVHRWVLAAHPPEATDCRRWPRGSRWAAVAAALCVAGCTGSAPRPAPAVKTAVKSVPELLAAAAEESTAQFDAAQRSGDIGLMAAIVSRPLPGVQYRVKSGSPHLGKYVAEPASIVRMGKAMPPWQAQEIQRDDVLTVRGDLDRFAQRRGSGLEPVGEFRRLTEVLAALRLRLGSQIEGLTLVTATSGTECESAPSNWIVRYDGGTRRPFADAFRQWFTGFFSTVPVRIQFDPESSRHDDASRRATLTITTCYDAAKREFMFGGPGNERWVAAAVNGSVTLTMGQVQVFSRCFRGSFVGPGTLAAGSKQYLMRTEAPLADALVYSDLPAVLTDLVADHWGAAHAAEATGKVLKEMARQTGPSGLEPYADAVLGADPARYRLLAEELAHEMRRSSHSPEKWAAVFPQQVLPRAPTACATSVPPMPAEKSRVSSCVYRNGKCVREAS